MAREVKSGKWCCRRELNSRPLPYQGSALPLSYGSLLLRPLTATARQIRQVSLKSLAAVSNVTI